MPTSVVLEPRATTLFLSAFFDAGVQSSVPWLSVAAMFGASPPETAVSKCIPNEDTENAAHPTLNAPLMRIVCPSRLLRSKVLLAIFDYALRRVDQVRLSQHVMSFELVTCERTWS
jgi:hypothetical protein